MNLHSASRMQRAPLTLPVKPPEGSGRGIGQILVDSGRLSATDAERIAAFAQDSQACFGQAARALGLLTDDDLRYALSVQFDYPYVGPQSSLSRELVAACQPDSAQVEQLRALRSQLMLRWFSTAPGRKALAVVSAGRGEGRSHLVANLAIVLSQLGERTLLVDADLRTPRQAELFGLGRQAGLSDMLAGRAGLEAIVPIPALRDLAVLPAGARPPNPQELLGRPQFLKLLQSLGQAHDVILLDTPAASDCADAHTVAVRAGGALLVARQGQTSLPQLAQLTHGLREFGVAVVGSVLNQV